MASRSPRAGRRVRVRVGDDLEAHVATGEEPLVVLPQQDGANETDPGRAVREATYHVVNSSNDR